MLQCILTRIAEIVTQRIGISDSYEPLFWFLLYTLSILIIERKILAWKISIMFAIMTLVLLVIYIIGSIQYTDISTNIKVENANGHYQWFHGDILSFM